MQTVKTIPGKTYAVESAGEVTITNTETGAIAAQGDGSGQVLFTACSNSYTVSDDAAKVVALFKLAPRLKLALLQGGAGGWLPKGFTELEYLESSGTQYIDTAYQARESTVIKTRWRFVETPPYAGFIFLNSGGKPSFGCLYADNVKRSRFDFGENYSYAGQILFNIGVDYDIEKNGQYNYVDGVLVATNTAQAPFLTDSLLIGSKTLNYNSSYRIYSFFAKDSTGKVRDLRPVLNANGIPGMWDTVSQQFFENKGSGTFGYRITRTGEEFAPMSLRDPWRVAPSGVYARRSGENALEILADTEETSGDGWEWFANTAEAYEHHGVLPEEEELLTE